MPIGSPPSVVAKRSVDQDDVRAAATDRDRQASRRSERRVRSRAAVAAGRGSQALTTAAITSRSRCGVASLREARCG